MFPRRLCARPVAHTFSHVKTDDTVDILATLWDGLMADARQINMHRCEVDAHFAEVPPGAREAARLRHEMQALRDEYARLTEEARSVARDFLAVQGSQRRFDA